MEAHDAYSGYINTKYKPKTDDLLCRFYVEPKYGVSIDAAASAVAAESSTGTWTEVSTAQPYVKKLAADVYNLDPHSGIVDIAYPYEAFEHGNVPQILSSVAGNVFGMKEVSHLRLIDMLFPKKMVKQYKGPVFGIPGIRKLLRVKSRPLVGAIIKPKMGLNVRDHAKVAYDAWLGGCDAVKDDENLTSQRFNQFEKRFLATIKARDKAEKRTGEKKVYLVNVTAETEEMLKRAEFVAKHGGEYVMVDIVTVGWSALQTLRNHNRKLKVVLHAHRAGHAAFTRNQKHGISMLVLCKLCRLIGLDQQHIGTMVGKMADAGVHEVVHHRNALVMKSTPADCVMALGQEWGDIKPAMPVASGGLHPGHFPFIIEHLGNDVILQCGGGVHGHPKGTVAGAKAARDAVDAALQGIPLHEYKSEALQDALKFWHKYSPTSKSGF
jgi:ribulose-bisphosphate carboxylase large chain